MWQNKSKAFPACVSSNPGGNDYQRNDTRTIENPAGKAPTKPTKRAPTKQSRAEARAQQKRPLRCVTEK